MLATTASTAVHAGETIEFSGEVARGDTLVHRFKHTDTLFEFRLVPFSGGWTIWIGEPMQRERNYVTVGAMPSGGVSEATIEGWHFRNVDNTGPNKQRSKNVNAPGLVREFSFAQDAASYRTAANAQAIVLWEDGKGTDAYKTALQVLKVAPKGKGTLTIDAMELGNLFPSERATIDRMAFTVRLEFP